MIVKGDCLVEGINGSGRGKEEWFRGEYDQSTLYINIYRKIALKTH
jgi:hypothetical protein